MTTTYWCAQCGHRFTRALDPSEPPPRFCRTRCGQLGRARERAGERLPAALTVEVDAVLRQVDAVQAAQDLARRPPE